MDHAEIDEEFGATVDEVRFKGCDDHHAAVAPDPDCEWCCKKWGITPGCKPRKALLSQKMLAARWQPGESGNVDGRPAGRSTMEYEVERHLDQITTINGEVMTTRAGLAKVLVAQALRNNPRRWAMELLFSRVWPEKTEQDVNLSGQVVQVVFDSEDIDA